MQNRFKRLAICLLIVIISGCSEKKKSIELVYELPPENYNLKYSQLQVEETGDEVKIRYQLEKGGSSSGLFFRSYQNNYFLASNDLGGGQYEAILSKSLLKSAVYEIGICPHVDSHELVFSNYFFSVTPKPEKIVISDENKVLYSFEKFVVESSKVQIQGWAYLNDQPMDFKTINVGLVQDSMSVFYDTELQERKDVTSYFTPGFNVDRSGFHVTIPTNRLQKGVHNIVLRIRDQVDSMDYFSFTERNIVLPQRLDSIPLETANIAYNIENVSMLEKSLQLKGWAYLNGKSSDKAEIYILFKADVVYAVKVGIQERKDVTAYFKSKINIDRSGFNLILDSGLPTAKEYQLGVLVVNKDDYGVAYTKTSFNLNF